MAKSSHQEVLMNFRLSAQDHARLKSFASGLNKSMSDLIRETLLEKMDQENRVDAQLLGQLAEIKALANRALILADASLFAACRIPTPPIDDLKALAKRHSEAVMAAKKNIPGTL